MPYRSGGNKKYESREKDGGREGEGGDDGERKHVPRIKKKKKPSPE
jgi:hypothetical protein